jgi:hypothetical protein
LRLLKPGFAGLFHAGLTGIRLAAFTARADID